MKSNEYGVHEQYPPEIIARRNELWQAFRYHQDRDDNVRFDDDKLFVNGMRLYPSSYRLRPEQTIAPQPVQQLQHPRFSVVSALNQQRIETQRPQIQQVVPPPNSLQQNVPHYQPQPAKNPRSYATVTQQHLQSVPPPTDQSGTRNPQRTDQPTSTDQLPGQNSNR